MDICWWFPSPGGDYGLSDAGEGERSGKQEMRFRPLAGIRVFRTKNYFRAKDLRTKFPSPGGD